MHNRRNQVATKPRPPRAKARPAPVFPAEVAIPPHLGSCSKAIALPPRVAAQPLFALPEREPSERLRTPPRPKKRKAPAKRRKPPGKMRKARAPKADPAEGIAAFALPRREEPLVMSAPPPQSRALAPVRPAGLWGQIGLWLSHRSESLWHRLGGRQAPTEAELRQLRAENARLKLQIEALLALQHSTPSREQDREPLPLA